MSARSRSDEAQNVESMKRESAKRLKLDEIGEWSELKLDILKKYAGAYCTILKARNLHPIYIDGFAGAGTHISKRTGELVKGSPLNALEIQPPFEELHLIGTDLFFAAQKETAESIVVDILNKYREHGAQ